MHAVVHGERTLTDTDFGRLTGLLAGKLPPPLADLLAVAEVMSSRAIEADVVTMYSRVELVDIATGRRQTLTICYPYASEPATGWISVLSPVGVSVLGLKLGDVARWCTPDGDECAAEIASIQYQPESTGDYNR